MTDPFEKIRESLGTTFETKPFQVDRVHLRAFEDGTLITEMYGEDEDDGYPDNVIPGFQVLSLIDPVTHGRLELGGLVGWNYGLNKVRFVRPALLDTPYRCRVEVVAIKDKPPGVLVELKVEMLDDDEQLVMLAEWLSFMRPLEDQG